MTQQLQEIVDQPQLSLMDGSAENAIRLFDELAMTELDTVTLTLQGTEHFSSVLANKTAPEGAEGASTPAAWERQRRVARGVQKLLDAAQGGRFLDYDGNTWVALLSDETYQDRSNTFRDTRSESPELEARRQNVALRGLTIYAQRRAAFATTQETPTAPVTQVTSLTQPSPQPHNDAA